jgi:hypothetical protein
VNDLSDMIPAIFERAWSRYGEPQMCVVQPIEDWAIPAGFAYDRVTDTIRQGTKVIRNPEAYWATDYLDFVPSPPGTDVRTMIAAGIVPAGTTTVSVLSEDYDVVKKAYAVQIDGLWYAVTNIEHYPQGLGSKGHWLSVTLQRRG